MCAPWSMTIRDTTGVPRHSDSSTSLSILYIYMRVCDSAPWINIEQDVVNYRQFFNIESLDKAL